MAFFSLLFFQESRAQIIIRVPDVPQICAGTPIGLSYPGDPAFFQLWLSAGGDPVGSVNPTYTVSYDTPGPKTVMLLLTQPPFIDFDFFDIVAAPVAPSTDVINPGTTVCEGEYVTVFGTGTGGVACHDEYRYQVDSGSVSSGWISYTEGDIIETGKIEEIVIQSRRNGCDATAGCADTPWTEMDRVTVTNNTVAPVLTCPADMTFELRETCDTLCPDLTSEPGFSVSDDCDPAPVVSQDPPAGSVLGLGLHTIELTATDAAGNESVCSTEILVLDDGDPEFDFYSAAETIAADTSYCGAYASWTEPLASDNCSVTVNASHSPGDLLPFGTTTVTYQAEDPSGNTSLPSTIDITVNARPDPAISGPADVCTPSVETYTTGEPSTHSYLWTVTNGIIVGSATDPSVNVAWTGDVQGSLSVQVTSGSGCSISNNMSVNKIPSSVTGTIVSGSKLNRR